MAAALVVGTVIGSGVFRKGKNVAENVPEFGLAIGVWILGGFLALLGSLAIAEVAGRHPRAGGNYVFLREAYGRLFGFLWGWVEFGIIKTASIAVLATMFTDSLHNIFQLVFRTSDEVIAFWPRQLIAISVIAVLSLINARGTNLGAGVQMVLTILKVGSLVGLALLPLLVLVFVADPNPRPTTNFAPLWPSDWSQVNWGKFGAAVVAVLWAYHGWMNLGTMAEDVKEPQRNLPRGLLGGVLVLIVLYVSANVAFYSTIPQSEMAELGNTPVATVFCFRLLGAVGIIVASAIVMTSVFGALNGNILVAPRLLYAMGEDGLAPIGLRTLHPRYRTPARAMGVYAVWSIGLVLAGGLLKEYGLPVFDLGFGTLDLNVPEKKNLFDMLTDYVIFGACAFETLAVATLFVFRTRDPRRDLPYRCPGYPVVPTLYILVMAAVLANMFLSRESRSEAVFGVAFVAAGVVVYFSTDRLTSSSVSRPSAPF